MPKRNIIWVIAIVTATATAMWVMRSDPHGISPGRNGRLSDFANIVSHIQSDYYVTMDSEKLKELQVEALMALARSLDEFSSYIPPDKVEAFKQRMAGTGRGLGLRTRHDRTGPTIVTDVLYNSPAYRARIQPDWRIVRIDDRLVSGYRPSEIRKALAPALGESVSLSLWAPNESGERTVTLTSEEFGIESVTGLYHLSRDSRWARRWGWMLDEKDAIVYIHVREFVGNTVERFDEAFRAAGARRTPRALVLDLRGNPGGQSNAAIRLADMFLSEGLIVRMLDRKDDVNDPQQGKLHRAHSHGTLADIPVVVLVDERTASGAELVAGALWANHRAVLVGAPTRGKWCAQSMIELNGELGLLNLTTSQFVFGRDPPASPSPNTHTHAIQPHQIVEIDLEKKRDLDAARDDAQRPPAPATDRPATRPASTRKTDVRIRLLGFDSQLNRALELLRKPEAYNALLEAERLRAKSLTGPGKEPGPNVHSSGNDD